MYSYYVILIFFKIIYIKEVLLWRINDYGCPLNKTYHGNCITLQECGKLLSHIQQATRNYEERIKIIIELFCGISKGVDGRMQTKICCPNDNNYFNIMKDKASIKNDTNYENVDLPTVNEYQTLDNEDYDYEMVKFKENSLIGLDEDASWRIDDSGCPLSKGSHGNCVKQSQCDTLTSFIQQTTSNDQERFDVLSEYACGSVTLPNGKVQTKVCCPYENNYFKIDERYKANKNEKIWKHKNFNLLPISNCGKLPTDDRILFGNKARLNEFPWMALIKFETEDIRKTPCAGTVINDRYILTAAHCFANKNSKPIEVILGEHNTQTNLDCELNNDGENECAPPVETYGIEDLIIHENFNSKETKNDIALIRLNQKINVNKKNIYPICLPYRPDLMKITNKNGIVSGWGTTEAELPSEVLLRAELSPVSNNDCQTMYSQISDRKINDEQICANGATNKSSTCSGDSGGPYQIVYPINRKAKYVQQGIISFRTVFCANDKPVVLTRISKFMSWILDNMKP